MADDELARIRQQRLAQLQASHGGPNAGKGPGGPVAGGDDPSRRQQQQQQQQQQQKEEEMRNNILSAVLTQEARGRLSTIAAAKPERARMVENIIIQNTRMGAIRGKVDEDTLKDLLEKVGSQTKRETKVQYERRRVFDDDSDDLDED